MSILPIFLRTNDGTAVPPSKPPASAKAKSSNPALPPVPRRNFDEEVDITDEVHEKRVQQIAAFKERELYRRMKELESTGVPVPEAESSSAEAGSPNANSTKAAVVVTPRKMKLSKKAWK